MVESTPPLMPTAMVKDEDMGNGEWLMENGAWCRVDD
jgi:hypothetical protein